MDTQNKLETDLVTSMEKQWRERKERANTVSQQHTHTHTHTHCTHTALTVHNTTETLAKQLIARHTDRPVSCRRLILKNRGQK